MGWKFYPNRLIFRNDANTADAKSVRLFYDAGFFGGGNEELITERVYHSAAPYNDKGHTFQYYTLSYGKSLGRDVKSWPRSTDFYSDLFFVSFKSGITRDWHSGVAAGDRLTDKFFDNLHEGPIVVEPVYKWIEYTIAYYINGEWELLDYSNYLPGVSFRMRPAYPKTGYDQTYWEDYATGQRYTPGSTVTLTTMSVRNFKPIYTPRTYTISYNNLFGIANNPNNPSTYNINTNTIYLSDPSNRPGYTFAGWYTASSGGDRVYKIDKGSTDNRTLYARWTPITYNITIDSNGGFPVNGSTYNIQTTSVVINRPNRTGHTFTGWSITSGPTGSPTISGNTVSIKGSYGDMTIMANWTTNKLNLSYNLVGGPGNTPSSVQIPYNNTFQLASTPANKPGYTFGGWEYNGTVRAANASVTPTNITTSINTNSSVDVTMDAKWNPITYTITIDSNGGTAVSNSTYNIALNTVTINRPTRVGFKFNGWTRTQGPSSGNPTIENDTITLNSSYGNMTYQAKWTPNVMTINYNLDGGVGTTPASQSIDYNNQFILATDSGVSKSGYNFKGWLINSNNFNSGALVFPSTLSSEIGNDDVTLEASANWSPTPYTVSFDSKGGSAVSPLAYDITTSTLPLPANPTRAGFLFDGWEVTTGSAAGTFVIEGSDMSFNQATGNITLSAKWVTDVFDITWGATGGSSAFPVTGELSSTKPTYYSVTSDTINPLLHIGTLARPGWNTPVFAPTSIPKGSTGSVTFNINSWSPNNYTITVSSSGTGAGINNSTYTTSQNNGTGISRTLTRGSRTGYTHGGWTVTRTGTSGGDIPTITGDTLNIPSGSYGNITITQTLNVVNYNITYEYNGSTNYEVEGALNNAPTTYNVNDSITYLKNSLNRKGWAFNTNWIQITGRAAGNNTIPQGSTGNKTVSILWDPVTYTITTSNFGSGTSISATNYSTADTNNGNVTVALTPGSKVGYRDGSWNLSRTGLYGGDDPTISDNVLTIPIDTYGSFNVNKVWVNNTYTISYDTKGAGTLPNKPATYDVELGTLPVLSKTGYVFNGWYLDGNLITSTSKNLTSVHEAVVKLTASWTPITYTVAYQTNGVGTLSNKTATYDEELGTLPELSKTGYVFNGWFSTNTNDNGGGTERTASSKNLRDTPGVVTIYAKWTANTYTITYDVKKYTPSKTKNVTYITGGNNSPLKAAAQQLVLDPAVEGGWNFVGRTVVSGFTYTHATNTLSISSGQTGHHSVGANWTPKTHVITRPTSKANTTTINYQTSEVAQTITIPGPSQPGWTAGAKSVTPNTLTISGESGSSSSTLDIPANHYGNITISTEWTGVTYTITVDPDNGEITTSISYTTSDSINTIDIPTIPTKDGYKRNIWSLSSNPSLGSVTISGNQMSISANTYGNFGVKMTWSLETFDYEVDFDGDGTVDLSGIYNRDSTVNRSFNVPTKSNQTLMGYQYEVTDGESGVSNILSRFALTGINITPSLNAINLPQGTYGSISLSAIWSNIYYKVIFNKNGADGTMSDQIRELGDGESLPLLNNSFSKERYTFVGWGRLEDGPVHYTDGSTANIADSNGTLPTSTDPNNRDEITLYAKWSAKHLRIGNNLPVAIKVDGEEVIAKYSKVISEAISEVIVWNKDLKISE